MPQRPARPCAHPGCPNLVRGRPRCPQHRIEDERRHRQATRDDAFYSLTAWRNCRRFFLANHPLCADCEREGRTEPAVDVHHIVDRRECNDPYDPINLEGLCKSHHNARRRQ